LARRTEENIRRPTRSARAFARARSREAPYLISNEAQLRSIG